MPIQRTNYVRNAWDFYKYEVTAYEAHQNDIFDEKDNIHQLILLRELEPLIPSQESYSKVITFLGKHRLEISNNDLLYNQILSDNRIENIKDIELLLLCWRSEAVKVSASPIVPAIMPRG